ncbi:hypothetical protein [Powai lake megavirus]|uniref:Nuclease n=1 Tax=Powai lake megavirus TaxID=1842663 RepID=A0A167RE19_9VIRU|nr:hypothetical protein QJ849_gp416 [Powai lake megavirus]ANB50578.1 hypothetical protein [Powai lake megavirus]
METKTCTRCKKNKKIEEFSFRSKPKAIRHEQCRACLNLYAKTYRNNNKEIIKKKQKIWYDSKGNVLKKEYDKKNLERTRQRDKNRYHTDPSYRTKKILRSRLAKVLKGEKKSKKTLEYVGMELPQLREWMEFQFDKNMTWNNQGIYWDIDHVTPCSSFDLSIEKEIYECFNWKNIRPLSKKENSNKSNKILEQDIYNHKKICREFQYNYLFGTK